MNTKFKFWFLYGWWLKTKDFFFFISFKIKNNIKLFNLFYIPWRKKKKNISYLKLLTAFLNLFFPDFKAKFDDFSMKILFFYHLNWNHLFFFNKSQHKNTMCIFKETRHLAKKKKNAKVCLVTTPWSINHIVWRKAVKHFFITDRYSKRHFFF